jgi:starch phosphorylase
MSRDCAKRGMPPGAVHRWRKAMAESTVYEEVTALAGNLASTWTGGRPVLDRVVEAAGGAPVGPWEAIRRVGSQGIEQLFSAPADRQALSHAFQSLSRYLASETWFDRHVHMDRRLEAFSQGPVAYFCMEFGLASWLPIYSGGLGILAGDVLKEASDLGLPFVGVGLFYQCGFFQQRMDSSDYQTEVLRPLDAAQLPLETALDASGRELRVSVPIADRDVHAKVWKLQVGRVPLYLLDTSVPENALAEDRAITHNLYGGDQDTRIRQEILLGIGGVRALHALDVQPPIFGMNEGHAAFLGLELVREQLPGADYPTALERTRQRVVYTNHTVIAAGNDVFPAHLVRDYLGRYAEESHLGIHRLLSLGQSGGGDTFSMPLLAFQVSGKANAVSALHAEIVPRQWPGFGVEAVTNGVHLPTWLGTEVRALLDEYLPEWQGDNPDWEAIRTIPDERLQESRDAQRTRMTEFVNSAQSRTRLDPRVLTIVWARRFAEYKRPWLIAADLGRLSRLLSDRDRPVQLIIAGKAHPKDSGAKLMMQQLLTRLDGDSEIARRTAFVEDYDEEVARYLTMGADVWLNTPRRPFEASGTSGMKSSDNGGLQVTVEDGWAAEVDWWQVGWGIEGHDDDSDARQLYSYLEDSVVPTFYSRDGDGIARAWLGMMKNSMIVSLGRYSARRMLLEYLNKLYLPLVGEALRQVSPLP